MDTQNTAIITLPDEIIHEEILPRLPVKSLLRFRCVSKSWRSLFRSTRFIKSHQQNSIKNPSFPQKGVISHERGYRPKECTWQSLLSELPSDPSPLEDSCPLLCESPFNSWILIDVLGCYNGLVCIRINDREFVLWNPSTRISKKLPEIDCDDRFDLVNCGFVSDESSGEYKVVALLSDSDSIDWDFRSCRCRVYSSKKKSWKTVGYNFRGYGECWGMVGLGVFVGGKLHWTDFRENYNDIIFFDLKSEVFGSIELPIDDEDCRCGEIGGFLCLLYHDLEYDRRDVRVWVMKESWERLVSLSLDHELLQRPFPASSFTHKGSNGEIFVLYGSTFLVYDPRDNAFRLPAACSQEFSHHVYVEGLLSPEDV